MVAYLSSRKGVFTDHKDRGLSPEILFRSMVGNSAGRDFSRTITVGYGIEFTHYTEAAVVERICRMRAL